MSRILVIDDDDAVRESTAQNPSRRRVRRRFRAGGDEGYLLAKQGAFDVILSDLRMPGLSGLDVLHKLRENRIDSAFIIMSAFGTVDTAVEAMKLGAVDFVQKPFLRDELLMRVRAAGERRQLARQVNLLQRQIRPAGSLQTLHRVERRRWRRCAN